MRQPRTFELEVTLKQTLAILMLVSVATLASAQAGKPNRTLLVTGTGHVSVAPDICYMRFGAESSSPQSASVAYRENNALVNAVVQALKTAGIPAKDMQTTGFYLSPKYDTDPKTRKTSISGYSVSQWVSVKVRDLSRVSAVLDAGVAAGANNVGGVNFTVEDAEKYTEKARSEALADARSKAEKMAADAGVRLGKPVTIEEEEGERMMVMGAGGYGGSQLEGGETELTRSVSVTYEME